MTKHVVLIDLAFALSTTPAVADWTNVRDMVRKADAESNPAAKERLLRKAYADAQQSVRRAPRVSNEYLWLANAAGRLAQIAGSKERIAFEYLTLALKHGVENPVEVLWIRGRAHQELDHEKQAAADYRACVSGAARNVKERELQSDARERLD